MNKKNRKNIVTSYNGNTAYYVNIQSKMLDVFAATSTEEYDNTDHFDVYFEKKVLSTEFNKIFIGEDKKRKHTYGNSVLVNTKDNEYIFINRSICKFQSISPIVQFYTPVKNYYVPYPYAKDTEGRIYLLVDFKNSKPFIPVLENHKSSDPWADYNGQTKNKPHDISFIRQTKQIHFHKLVYRK
jgi:hypothetical protein